LPVAFAASLAVCPADFVASDACPDGVSFSHAVIPNAKANIAANAISFLLIGFLPILK
jgi:hypothetical protein